MRKIVVLMLVLMILVTFCSCGGNAPICEKCNGTGEVYRSCLLAEMGSYILSQDPNAPSRSEIISNHTNKCPTCRKNPWVECSYCDGTGKAS